MTTNQQISITGGSEKTTYNASIGYYRLENTYQAHAFERLTSKITVDTQINDFLKIGLSGLSTYSKNIGNDNNPVDQALRATPFITPYKADGTLRTFIPGSNQQVWNPLLDEIDGAVVDDRKTLTTFTTGFAEVTFPLGIRYRFNGGMNLKYHSIGRFEASETTKRKNDLNWAFNENQWTCDYTLENILTWDYSFKEAHHFVFTGLFSYQEQTSQMNKFDSYDYFDENIQYYNPKYATSIKGEGEFKKWSILSYMARMNYNFKDRYLLTATVRYDGSSRLADDNRWHSFPSVALGWNIKNEAFMENVDFLSSLKLRGSWGNVGSTAISPYQTLSRPGDNKYIIGTTPVMGVRPNTVPDITLGWENTETINAGVDFGILSNRITGTIEVYRQNR